MELAHSYPMVPKQVSWTVIAMHPFKGLTTAALYKLSYQGVHAGLEIPRMHISRIRRRETPSALAHRCPCRSKRNGTKSEPATGMTGRHALGCSGYPEFACVKPPQPLRTGAPVGLSEMAPNMSQRLV